MYERTIPQLLELIWGEVKRTNELLKKPEIEPIISETVDENNIEKAVWEENADNKEVREETLPKRRTYRKQGDTEESI